MEFSTEQINAIAETVRQLTRYTIGFEESRNTTYESGVLLDDLEQALVEMISRSNECPKCPEPHFFRPEPFINTCNGKVEA